MTSDLLFFEVGDVSRTYLMQYAVSLYMCYLLSFWMLLLVHIALPYNSTDCNGLEEVSIHDG